MSDRQFARSVVEGRLLSFHIPGIEVNVKGYLAGRDDYHWLIATSDRRFFLVHKSIPVVEIGTENSYKAEPPEVRDYLEKVIGPFRRTIGEQGFGRSRQAIGHAGKGISHGAEKL